jgi:ABC-2 type transport system ATP-binding protein
MSDVPTIQAVGLTRRFGDRLAVDGLDLKIFRGEIYGLVGPDGAGKTTTLRMLAGILDPSAGEARVAGCDVLKNAAGVKERIAYMSQRFGLYADLTVKENIDFYADLYGVSRKARAVRLEELLGFSGMRPYVKRRAGQLSGGMKQKLQLICALIHTPQVLLLDEPTNGVDPVSRRDFWQALYQLLRQGVTILTTTAYLDEAERCHRVGLLHQGTMLIHGTPTQIKAVMEEEILAVRAADPRRAAALLRRRLKKVHLFGGALHVATRESALTTRIATELLTEYGIPILGMEVIEPSLEDLFVQMVGKETDQTVSSEVTPSDAALHPSNGMPAVSVQELTRQFGTFTAVDNISFTVAAGEIFGFLGPNGAGKSTTIRMLCGLLAPTSGGGSVSGFDIVSAPEAIKSRIGYMSQKFSLYDDLTVAENIAFYGAIYNLDPIRLNQRSTWALEVAGLVDQRSTLTKTLSGGWKQRLALACAVLHEPPILFLDEPTSGVDPLSRRRFWDLIYNMARRGITIFVTTHYMEEAEYCDRLALIDGGKIIALGSPAQLKNILAVEALFDLRCEAAQEILPRIRALPGVGDVTLFGAGLHIRSQQPEVVREELRGILESMNLPLDRLRLIPPNMEDVFVALIDNAKPGEIKP